MARQRNDLATVVQRMREVNRLSHSDVLHLQRAIGNRAVQQFLLRRAALSPAPEKSNNTGLPDNLKDGLEHLSGMSLDDVRVKYNSDRPAQVQAWAFASGTDIHLAPGQERHVAHEAWHVVQQKQGRVKPTLREKGVPVNDESHLEQEADVMAARASQRRGSELGTHLALAHAHASAGDVVQRVSVQSDWLRIEPPSATEGETESSDRELKSSDQTSDASNISKYESKKREAKEPTIYTAKGPDGPYVKCEDTTDAGYRDQAEKDLGQLRPLDLLSRWGIIPAPGQAGASPFAKAHLIAAEFGGQKKYRPRENIRFHARELEYGEWQQAENTVKRKGRFGYLTVGGRESKAAARTAKAIVDIVRGTLDQGKASQLEGALTKTLGAADYVPDEVEFDYTDKHDSGLSFVKQWGNQAARLQVDAKAKEGAVYGALAEMKLLADLGVQIPGSVAADAKKAERVVSSRAWLVALLAEFCGDKENFRKKKIKDSINKALNIRAEIFGDAKFAEQLKKLPELKDANFTLTVTGDFRKWLDKSQGGALLTDDLK